MNKQKNTTPVPRYGGALVWGVIGPRMMPCLFGTKQDAEEGCDFDERVALFKVEEVTLRRGYSHRKPPRPARPSKPKSKRAARFRGGSR